MFSCWYNGCFRTGVHFQGREQHKGQKLFFLHYKAYGNQKTQNLNI
jgi:hypothetical protein